MPDDTTASRAPDIADQLWAFNEARRQVLDGKPIDPEGDGALGRLLSDPPAEDEPHPGLDR